jgi:hypothetical protein
MVRSGTIQAIRISIMKHIEYFIFLDIYVNMGKISAIYLNCLCFENQLTVLCIK